MSARAATFPTGFDQTAVFTGHTKAVSIRFAANGQIFVGEQNGLIWVYENLNDTTRVEVVDVSIHVHSFWDRGMLGMAIDPGYPVRPYLYILYAHNVDENGDGPRWFNPSDPLNPNDICPNPPGATGDGCVVYGRLSRVVVDTATMTGVEEPLLDGNWCQQYPSHSTGDLVFGDDGMLYASAGDGASFNWVDWGQDGNPVNPCGDPPDGVGSSPADPLDITGEGGALRSQDILTPSTRTDLLVPDPTSFDGTVLRIDVSDEENLPKVPSGNPLVGNGVPDDDFIIAIGLRNPYRIGNRPGTGEIWVGDVGWGTWEEINRISAVLGDVENFGWPCYEGNNSGSAPHSGYGPQTLCVDLYAGPPSIPTGIATTAPYYAYRHNEKVVSGEACGTGSSAISGIAFYTGSNYPSSYADALAFSDSSRRCVWTMFTPPGGDPDKTNIQPLVSLAANRVVDVEMGPDGNLYYVEYHNSNGKVWRVEYTLTNDPPLVYITKPLDGASFVTGSSIDFAGSASDTEDGSLTSGLAWTSSIDGSIGTGESFSISTLAAGTHLITAEATDSNSDSGSDDITITVHDAPVVSITAPSDGHTAVEGESIDFTGTANDTEDGDLTASIEWSSSIDGDIGSGGSFSTSSLSLGSHTITATATDSHGAEGSDTLSVIITLNTDPEVTLSQPTDGSVFLQGTSISFAGSASDQEDGDITADLSWSSTLDSGIGTGGSFSRVLSVGDHTIIAAVTDSHGGTDSASVDITVNAPPTISITAPADGHTVVEGTSINFTGTAGDSEDGDLTAGISWSSNLSGAIGTGGSVTTSALSVGSHTITAEVTDGHGETRTDAIGVTITPNTAPNVAISAPTNGSVFLQGTSIGFSGTATDNEDGNISGSLIWTSSIDSGIGSGASFSVVLMPGDHVITAMVTDSHGAANSANISVTVNVPPTVTITAPADGLVVDDGTSVVFSGTANDTEDGDIGSNLAWSSSLDGAIGSGSSFSTSTLSVGTHTITASVTDSDGATETDTITVKVNAPPTVSITAPADGHTVVESASINFTGTATDSEDGDLAGDLSWTSSINGVIGSGASFSTSTLSVGNHTITALVTDSDGGTDSDSISVTVTANTAPSVLITAPADGSLYQQGDSISFTGSASDTEDGDLTAGLSWSSGLDGTIGSGGSFSSSTLSVGAHTITASVTDSHSETGSATIGITVNAPPVVAITAPANGHTVVDGTPTNFTGTASDTEDGDLATSLTWTSSINGAIGSGGSFSTSTLSVGTHTITASVTDSDGGTDSESISVTVTANSVPSVSITAPADGSLFQKDASVSFAGTASDTEDGDLTANLSWTSSLDGGIGSGGSFSTSTLSVGTHTITASVTDSHSETGSASIAITINDPPVVAITDPTDGHAVVENTLVSFTGTANDTEDGNLASSLTWTSSIDGTIGTGASFSTATLAVGTHIISAGVTDTDGGTDSDSVSVTITANSTPSVSITSPADGSLFQEGASISFAGSASDTEDGDLTASLSWTSSLDGTIGSGGSFSVSNLSVGAHTITASATDAHGETGSATLAVAVNAPPAVSITAPADGHTVVEDTLISFTGTASDTEDGNLAPSLSWTSSINGAIGSGGSFSTPTLSVGTHTITASVTDNDGGTDSDSISVTVTANAAPSVSITAPADGSLFQQGDSISFTGSASDTEDGDLTAGLSWTSSVDGGIGSGGSFSTSTLSVGTHTITASVTDSHSETGSASIAITVNEPPLVDITAPANGHSVVDGTPINFAGTASDTEDGDLAAGLAWTSSINGAIGSGGSFSTSTLSVGTHTITASVTDSDGGTDSESISVTVTANSAPSVSITAPADGSLFQQGVSISFAGSASDTEDGDLTTNLGWSSSIDGAIGSSGSFSTSTLSMGTHTITASVTDSHSETGSAAIAITVNEPPLVDITAPADGHTVVEGTPINFTGTASDTEDGNLAASLAWISNIDGAIGSGASFSTSILSVGTHTITASVTDSDGGTDSDSISVTITANTAPTASITTPTDGSLFQEGASISFTGSASDTEDGDLTTSLGWSSSIDGAIGSGGSFSTSTLSVGVHTITASVTDSHSETGSAAIAITVNDPPLVNITSPANGHTVVEGTSINFAGTATDTEDGDLAPGLSWTSSINGAIGSGGSFSSSALSVGTHTITATATDSDGGVDSDSISVTITSNTGPSVSITAPADGSPFQQGTSISFAGSASDTEDGDLTTGLSWTSDLDGPIGSGGSFSTSTLSVGTHLVTASVQDSHSEIGSASITVTINAPPQVSVDSPAGGSSTIEGTPVSFTATATDMEDGDLAPGLSWTSSIDGAIGSGGSFSISTLSVGTHTITASVTDSDGGTDADSILLTINANTAPSVTITAPPDGTVVDDGQSIAFTGTANDTEDGDLTGSLSWTSSIDGAIGSGGSFSSSALSVGTHTITASVTDSHSEIGSAAIAVTVNDPPLAAITAPADGHTVVEEMPINFTGTASDTEDGDLTANLIWTSSVDGGIGSGGSFSTSTLSVGTHTVTAAVTDSDGSTDSDSISVTVTANTGPSVSITAPADGSLFQQGASISFTGSASDTEDGDLTAGLSWTSSLDGAVGSGGSFSTSTLSVGIHTITASVQDSHGESGSASITVKVNAPPVVTISSPVDGHTVVEGTPIGFAGAATDPEDGDLAASLSWTSSINGAIGSGASFSSSTLSVGTHTITATATDSDGGVDSDSISVTITSNTGPNVSITAPADGSLFQKDTSINFAGSASDTEDGDLTDSLGWSSSIDGAIGTGGSFSSSTLSVGTHLVTASATDSHGETGSASISITVNDPPLVSITAPADGHTVVEDTLVGFTGTAIDTEDGNLAAGLSWTSTIDGAIGSGASFSTATLSVDTHTITSSITDSDGASDSDSISVTITANTTPTVSITAPADGSLFQQGAAISFSGSANDTEDGYLTTGLSWTSDLDGAIGSGGSFSTSTLSVGTHTITALATDSHGEAGTAAITVTVNSRPVVTITTPVDGHSVVEDTPIHFAGTATDTEDGDLTASLSWASNIDGAIGSGDSFSISTLSVGTHTITASAADSDGGAGSESISVTVTSNTGPSVSITAPADGSLFQQGASISFTGSASDTEDGDLTAGLSWTSSLDGTIGSGGSFATSTLSVGTHTITASATDRHSEIGSASITTTVNDPPAVSITAPADGHEVVEGTSIHFTGTVNDSEDGDLAASLSWASSIDGAIGSGGSFSSSGLSVGSHTITASVTDSDGGTDSESISVVVSANIGPTVSITAPADGALFQEGASIDFAGSANDTEDGDLTGSISWSSSIDGAIGSGGAFSLSTLSAGDHTITATVEDSHGTPGSATLDLTVNAQPVVAVTAPTDGHSVVEGTSVTFTGTAIDTEDGDLAVGLAWTSSLNGAIGAGESFSISTLAVGTHTITASATDSDGGMDSDSISVTITANTTPTVSITAPADGWLFQQGAAIDFSGSADDTEDGDLTDSLSWTSSLDGAFGSGGSFSTSTLSVGTHTITASVADSHGETGTAAITITVNSRPVATITAPAEGHTVVEDTSINFVGTATDAEDGDVTVALAWSSSIDGAIGSGGSFATSMLSVGTHIIIASVTDNDAGTNSDSITVTIVANQAPVVIIAAPVDDTVVLEDTPIDFSGSALDHEDGDLSGALAWVSNLDGVIGSGPAFSVVLSVGTHTVTAAATDGHGATGLAAVVVTVNSAPTVTITAPEDGLTFAEGFAIGFSGEASDSEDGDLAGGISWSSDLDGFLGTGNSLATALSQGLHTITAAVTDSHGETRTDSISVLVRGGGGLIFADGFESGNTSAWEVPEE